MRAHCQIIHGPNTDRSSGSAHAALVVVYLDSVQTPLDVLYGRSAGDY